MSKKGWLYIGFFTALVIGFYLVLTALIPDFNKKKVGRVGYVKPFAFRTQDNKIFTQNDIKGKVCVVEYFFTTCKGICPIMNANMKKVYEEFKNEKEFYILSHTCDPGTDSVPVLKKYAESMGVNSPNWIFLTGRKDSLYNMARESYMIDDPKNNVNDINDDFLHTQNWALVDKKGNVVAIYDGLKMKEINGMMGRIKELLRE